MSSLSKAAFNPTWWYFKTSSNMCPHDLATLPLTQAEVQTLCAKQGDAKRWRKSCWPLMGRRSRGQSRPRRTWFLLWLRTGGDRSVPLPPQEHRQQEESDLQGVKNITARKLLAHSANSMLVSDAVPGHVHQNQVNCYDSVSLLTDVCAIVCSKMRIMRRTIRQSFSHRVCIA